jgi:hypothetical protein
VRLPVIVDVDVRTVVTELPFFLECCRRLEGLFGPAERLLFIVRADLGFTPKSNSHRILFRNPSFSNTSWRSASERNGYQETIKASTR